MAVRSKKVRESARMQDCTARIFGICNYNPETTVLAHLPCGSKGTGMKGDDQISIYACEACHSVLDGRAKGEIDWKDMLRALAETQRILIEKGILVIK